MKTSIQFIFTAVVVIFVLAALIWFAGGQRQSGEATLPGSASLLAASETFFDFGSISMAQGNVSHMFSVKNPNDFPVTVTKTYTSCMCTTARLMMDGAVKGPFGMPGHGLVPRSNFEIPAGKTFDVEVIFDPAAHGPAGVGKVSRIVYLESENGRPLELSFNAVVTP